MVTFPIRPRLTLPIAPLVAVVAAFAVIGFVLGAPQALLDELVMTSGLPALFPAAEPPLGTTARLALSVTLGGAAGALGWLTTYCLTGERAVTLRPAPRRAMPERAPLIATRDLGAPFLDVKAAPRPPVVRQLPVNLDTPLAAFDPDAIPDEPVAPVPLVAPLARAELAPGERLEAFELPTPIVTPHTDATIQSLLERLERGIATRPRAAPEVETIVAQASNLQATLGELRRLAVSR